MTSPHVKRFTARTSREALRLVREALGDDAVVLSTKPSVGGFEVLAMAPEGIRAVEQIASLPGPREADLARTTAEEDAARLEMSTLSFQDYVRNRMLKRRKAALGGGEGVADAVARAEASVGLLADAPAAPAAQGNSPAELYAAAAASHDRARSALAEAEMARFQNRPVELPRRLEPRFEDQPEPVRAAPRAAERKVERAVERPAERAPVERATEPRGLEQRMATPLRAAAVPPVAADPIRYTETSADAAELMAELRSMKGLIEERFGALAFMEKLQRRPGEARLTQQLLDCGFSPALIRKLANGLTVDTLDESAWAADILERNLHAAEGLPIEEQGGVFALIGATGVGKTTTTAKIAAAFAAKHGAGNLGLITLDAYRVGAHEQLRAYGRILGVPVHTAHDRASLEDLLELLAGKKMVLIDTAGMAQRDSRTRELLEMLSHPSIKRLLVLNAASQGETIEDVVVAYKAATCVGVVLSKIDEAVKLGPALDAAIRHKLSIVGVANGQRVPEDWHRLSANALVQRALRGGGSSAWRFDAGDMNLVFAAARPRAAAAAMAA